MTLLEFVVKVIFLKLLQCKPTCAART